MVSIEPTEFSRRSVRHPHFTGMTFGNPYYEISAAADAAATSVLNQSNGIIKKSLSFNIYSEIIINKLFLRMNQVNHTQNA